jgi:DNA helicase-2/ATP-dependent DNA helicase PcrA
MTMSPPRQTAQEPTSADVADTAEVDAIVGEEQACLDRVLQHIEERRGRTSDRPKSNYDEQMLTLRDEIATARLEDLPPLYEQMDRIQSLAAHRRQSSQGWVDARSPYFGRLVLQEGDRRREVLIGRSTYLDSQSGIRIVDWRDAPVSRLYYRYDEGDDYDEEFGGREVHGDVITRRNVNIVESELKRIGTREATYVRGRGGQWQRLGDDAMRLSGGQGSALRAESHHAPGSLGVGLDGGEDRHLREITALIDPRQFDLITQPDSGLVVIQGGAGSGKTTIGLHRLAYLAYHDTRRFRPDKMLVIAFNEALVRYISQVLPALGVSGIPIRTYESWAERTRAAQLPRLPRRYNDATPGVVTRMKKHPAMLRMIDDLVDAMAQEVATELQTKLGESAEGMLSFWRSQQSDALAHRFHSLRGFLERGAGRRLDSAARTTVQNLVDRHLARTRDVLSVWADAISDRMRLEAALTRHAPGAFSDRELTEAHAWCAARATEMVDELMDSEDEAPPPPRGKRPSRPPRRPEQEDDDRSRGIDGARTEERATFDREDDALLLRLCQRLRGPLRRGARAKEALVYEHVLVDEAQDLSPVELAVVLGTVSRAESVTLAGDVAQRLLMDNGFSDWKTVLSDLGKSHVEIEPLKLSYRSTLEILEVAHAVLGPLAPEDRPTATRSGAPVELFTFGHTGDAVGFLGEALRQLVAQEPRASVAVITRYAEQADTYYDGLKKGEVPFLRRIAEQDFPFRPGVDVTDVRQVKGLEFDYVIVAEASKHSYPDDDESRHLLHIAATRAAHQLWFIASGTAPSLLLPQALLEQSY